MLNPELREWLWPFLGGIAKKNDTTPRCIGGVADHVHLLLSLPTTVPIAKAIQLIKQRLDHRPGFTRLFDNCTTLAGNRVMALSV